jgi:cysteinyl-tRNA synthetase
VRYLLLSTTYRQPMNFTLESLEGAARSVERVRSCVRNLVLDASAPSLTAEERTRLDGFEQGFRAALAEDLNTSAALAQVFDAVRFVNGRQVWDVEGASRVRALFSVFDAVLDVLEENRPVLVEGPTDTEIARLVAEREAARQARDFTRSDAIRQELGRFGVLLEDTPSGPRWTRR